MTNQGTPTGVQAAIEAANEVFMATFNRGDTAALADLYTENGQLLPAGSDFVTGKQNYQDFFFLVWPDPVHLACQGKVPL